MQTTINSVTADSAGKRIKVVYTNAKELPLAAVPSAKAFYKETKRGGSLDSKKFSTKKGKHTLYVSTKGALHMVNLEITGVRGVKTLSYTRLVKPGTFTNTRTVSGAEAVAGAISVHVPGAVLTFVPQTRIIRFAGAALLGWTVASEVKSALTGSGGKCPKLSKGQVIRSSVTWSQRGESVSTARTFQVWHSAKDRNAGKAAACTVKSTFSYR
ncbi:hypothetical protein [Citricoccus sp. NR2]|uniref:hypothetical protein n=1 Tax=Citricoccus sp. NR2 TaxID=3004095 RepID=UPI0022DE849C|nr:hypothetical protein [Citricoccus sp. NR2]WBL19818.1 hypothetical protein O1A05_03750 [Citricoccus sp. NR2]